MGAAIPSRLRHLQKPSPVVSSLSTCLSVCLVSVSFFLASARSLPQGPTLPRRAAICSPSLHLLSTPPPSELLWMAAGGLDYGTGGPRCTNLQGGLLLWWLVPEGIILATALLFLLAKCVGVQQAFARERRQKIKLFKLQFCRQIERPPNSSELPNLAPSTHLRPRKW